jgi:hypothetical protein
MDRNEILDLILKAAAVYLFVLAVLALPGVVESLIYIVLISGSALATFRETATLGESMVALHFGSAVADVLRIVLCLVVGRNLFRGGSWLRRILGAGKSCQPEPTG